MSHDAYALFIGLAAVFLLGFAAGWLAVRGEDTPREHRWLCEHVGCTIPGRHAHVPIAVDGRGEDNNNE